MPLIHGGDGSSRVASEWNETLERKEFVMSRADSGNAPQQQGQQQGMTDQLKDKAGEVASNLRDMGSQVRDMAGQQYQQALDTAQDYYQQGRDKAMEWQGELEEYVRDQPLKALAIAAGVGVVLGILWKRS
jgi:ElaB/YqjD/DUF883 family membrane-anchored ribosome-binding protein